LVDDDENVGARRSRRREFLGGVSAVACATVGCGGEGPDLGGGRLSDSDGGSESSTGAAVPHTDDSGPDDDTSHGGGHGSWGPLNVILITADDLGWKALTAHTGVDHCPHLRALAAQSQVFERAFNATSSCSSSRTTFATGLYPSQHGVTGLVHRHPERSLPAETFVSARALAEAGYATGIAGKFHMSDVLGAKHFGYDERATSRLKDTEFVETFLEAHQEGPFYLELNFTQTHRRGNPRRFSMHPDFPVDPRAVHVPEFWGLPDIAEIREEVAGYLSQFCVMDDLIGQVLTIVDRLELRDETLVMFVSDNGVSMPGNKQTLYDRGIGSPCLVRDPRHPSPAVSTTLVSSIDIAPTVLDAAGVPHDMLPGLPIRALDGSRDAVFAEMFWHRYEVGTRAIRTERWKYIINTSLEPMGTGEVSSDWVETLAEQPWSEPRVPLELYDLDADPHERTNVVGDYPEEAAVLHERLLAHMDEVGDTTPVPDGP